MINYKITPKVNSHTYVVTMLFNATNSAHILRLPAWIPGSYMIREFSKNIIDIYPHNRAVECCQVSKDSWRLTDLEIGSVIIITYTVYANEVGIRSAFLDFNRGYFNNTSICLYVEGMENLQHVISLDNLPQGWQIATGLPCVGSQEYLAQNYDELIDSPFELGSFTRLNFIIRGKPFYLVLSGIIIDDIDTARLIKDISKICQTQIELFGGCAPFDNYTFILYLGGDIYTGLEHRNSTLLMAPYSSVPVLYQSESSDDYIKLLGLISHEFFHTWNVKRVKPSAFNPYNLNAENYTTLLWWFEGITSYYDDLILRKAGLIDDKRYLGLIVKNINDVYKYSGVTQQTLANSSLTAWTKYYRQDENSPNSVVSYYVKGALVGLCLDLLIRSQSDKSLDDVMCGLYNKWRNDGLGIAEDEIPQLIKQYTGCDLTDKIKKFTQTCEELPLTRMLQKFGVRVHELKNRRHDEVGKVIDKPSELPNMKNDSSNLDLGCKLTKEAIGYRINHVYSRTVARSAGLSANDVIIAINDIKLTDINKQLNLYKVGDVIKLTIFRLDALINIKLRLQKPKFQITYLEISNYKELAEWL